MLELQRPLMRVLDGSGLMVKRLTSLIPLDLKNFDADHFMLSMPESHPDYSGYLNRQALSRHRAVTDEARGW